MGLYASVYVAFGIDLGALDVEDARDAAEGMSDVAVDVAGEQGDDPHAIVYAPASYRSLLSHKTVEVPVLDTDALVTRPSTAALRAFCDAHGLPWAEPRWLIVSDVS